MKYYLWWGWNADGWSVVLDHMHQLLYTIQEQEWTKQFLHIPFARTWIRTKSRDALHPVVLWPIVESWWVQYLDARYYEDIEQFTGDTIYISWGNDTDFLMQMCSTDILQHVLGNWRVIIGDSAGSMIFGRYYRSNHAWWNKGFGIISDTIIEAHYSQWNKDKLLAWLQLHPGMKGLGIDEMTFVLYEKWQYGGRVWTGWVYQIAA